MGGTQLSNLIQRDGASMGQTPIPAVIISILHSSRNSGPFKRLPPELNTHTLA